MNEAQRRSGTSELFQPGSAGPVGQYLRRVWSLRYFIAETAKGRLIGRNRGLAIGNAWIVLEPALMIAIYFFIFSVLLGASRGVENFLLFLVVGRSAFSQHQSAVLGSSTALSGNSALLRNTTIPRIALPLGVVLGTVYEWFAGVAMIAIIALLTWETPRLMWLLIIPITLGMAALNLGLGLLLAPTLTRFQDVRRAMPNLYRLVFYCTGVMFPVESFIERTSYADALQHVLLLNPIYGYVKALQFIFTGYEAGIPGRAAVASIVWTLILLPLGFFHFLRHERSAEGFRNVS